MKEMDEDEKFHEMVAKTIYENHAGMDLIEFKLLFGKNLPSWESIEEHEKDGYRFMAYKVCEAIFEYESCKGEKQ